jgi:DNA topoisomerase VI subunit B
MWAARELASFLQKKLREVHTRLRMASGDQFVDDFSSELRELFESAGVEVG